MYPSAGAGTNQASCAFWKVGDVEAVVKWLKGRGVVFEEYDMPGMKSVNSIFTGGGAKAAWFKDSEGNIMALVQDLGEQSPPQRQDRLALAFAGVAAGCSIARVPARKVVTCSAITRSTLSVVAS